jgi:WD40 repeat protein
VLAVLYQEVQRGLVPPGKPVITEVKLWDVATGKEVAGPTPPWFDPQVVSFTPDGKTMAVAVPQSGTTFEFRDTATGRVRGEFRVPPTAEVTALALGPDRRPFIGGPDGTVLAWDTRAVKPPPADRK